MGVPIHGRGPRPKDGLGPLHTISLAEARNRTAPGCFEGFDDGIDFIDYQKASCEDRKGLEAAKTMTFKGCADSVYSGELPRLEKSQSTLTSGPRTFNEMRPGELDLSSSQPAKAMSDQFASPRSTLALGRSAGSPFGTKTPELASRVRGRIEAHSPIGEAPEVIAKARIKGDGDARSEQTLPASAHPRLRQMTKPSPTAKCRLS